MNDLSIEEFCKKHKACSHGRNWAIEHCRDMAHAWETLRPKWLVWVATKEGVLDDKTLRLFAVWCARRVQHLMKDKRSVATIDVAERFAHGNATAGELATAWSHAMDAASHVAIHSAKFAAMSTARRAAMSTARDAAMDSARQAARFAAMSAATAAAISADLESYAELDLENNAEMTSQADWLRKNAKPNFK